MKSLRLSLQAFLLCCMVQGGYAQSIELYNSSFEDYPRAGRYGFEQIRGWKDCGFAGETPPDIHSGNKRNPYFDVTVQPMHGKTFLGMVARNNDSYESVSQRLTQPLEADRCYAWSIHLCKAPVYNSAVRDAPDVVRSFTRPIVLRIWAGDSGCHRGELLAESEPVKNVDWEEYIFNFQPSDNYNYLILEAFYKTPVLFPYNGNILFDLASPIVSVECDLPEEDLLAAIDDYEEERPELPQGVKRVESRTHKKPPAVKKTPKTTSPPPVEKEPEPEVKTPKPDPEVNKEPPVVGVDPSTTTHVAELSNTKKLRTNQVIRLEALRFDVDSTRLVAENYSILNEVHQFLIDNPRVRIEVRGHTNGLCESGFCDKLSTDRARVVRDYLISQGGIKADRIRYKGYGKRKPIASNATTSGRNRNQRVEIKILSLTG